MERPCSGHNLLVVLELVRHCSKFDLKRIQPGATFAVKEENQMERPRGTRARLEPTTLQFKKLNIPCLLASVLGGAIYLECMMGPSITLGAISDGPFCDTCSKGTQVSCIIIICESCMDSFCLLLLCFLLMPGALV